MKKLEKSPNQFFRNSNSKDPLEMFFCAIYAPNRDQPSEKSLVKDHDVEEAKKSSGRHCLHCSCQYSFLRSDPLSPFLSHESRLREILLPRLLLLSLVRYCKNDYVVPTLLPVTRLLLFYPALVPVRTRNANATFSSVFLVHVTRKMKCFLSSDL